MPSRLCRVADSDAQVVEVARVRLSRDELDSL